MNTQLNQNDSQAKIELRMRTMRTLWIALLFSIGGYYVLTFFVQRSREISPNPNTTLSLALVCAGMLIALISFPIKSKLLTKAVEQQQGAMVQQAYTVAWALSEVAALFGLVDFFVTGNRYFFVLFIIALGSDLLHFPQREHVINASFKNLPF